MACAQSGVCPTVGPGIGSGFTCDHILHSRTQRGDDMRLTRHRRWLIPVAGAAAVGLALTGCTGDIANEDAADVDCSDYEQYGTFEDADVTASGTILDLEADRLNESWADFETCTGINVDYQGSSEFEA